MYMEETKMDFPTNEQCYDAMYQFASYYMEGDVKEKWLDIIADGLKTGRSAPGKGFLYDLDKAIKVSGKPNMPKRKELYQLICEASI